MNACSGTLYIVATPLGNLKDITFRAVEVLQAVHCIAAEDTRHSLALLKNFSIKTPMVSLHEHNEQERSEQLLYRLQQGESIALISDAGTPLVSDPGSFLVKEALARGLTVSPVPGPSAVIAALSVSGLWTGRFTFEGFLPTKPKLRRERLEALRQETRTMVFYEAPHRILGFLEALQTVFEGTRQAMFARELTKVFETIKTDTLEGLKQWVAMDKNQQRGEMVIVVAGAREGPSETVFDVLPVLLKNLPLKQAVDIASEIMNIKKNELYQRALQLKNAE